MDKGEGMIHHRCPQQKDRARVRVASDKGIRFKCRDPKQSVPEQVILISSLVFSAEQLG